VTRKTAETRKAPVQVRATINLTGLTVGQVVYVDPNSPYIAECIEAGLLVPVKAEQ
jgi:hypothetical protein